MSKSRNIDLHLNLAEFEQEIMEHTNEIYNAIGYFSQFAMHNEGIYDELSIVAAHGGHEIIASYYSTETKNKLTMGAVWRGQEYSFHS